MGVALNILIVGTAAATGWGAGWWFGRAPEAPGDESGSERQRLKAQLAASQTELQRAREEAARHQHEAQQARSDVAETRRSLELVRRDAARTKEVIDQLQALAQRIAADVDTHSHVVQSVNVELGEGPKEANDVLAAVAKLIEANSQMQRQLDSAESKLQQQSQQLRDQITEARTDALTALANRRAFDEQLGRVEQVFQQQQRPACVMMIDVDHFKRLNDTYGHRAGDEVLRHVAHTLQQQFAADALVCRYGGEEFAVVFAGADLESVRPAAERARQAVGKCEIDWEDEPLRVTVSAGLAELRAGESAADMLHRADAALYASKQAGRNCGHWHDGQQCHALQTAPATPPLKSAPVPANRDPLTGLATHQFFCDALERRLAEWRRGGPDLSMLMVEVDDFAALVREHGQGVGETVLRATAQFLRAAMRDMDYVARFDTHQFALLLPTARQRDAQGVAERLRAAIEKCKLPSPTGDISFAISIALTEAQKGDTNEPVLTRLQAALQTAHRQGGNCTEQAPGAGQDRLRASGSGLQAEEGIRRPST